MSFRCAGVLSEPFAQIRAARAEALAVFPTPTIDQARAGIAELALRPARVEFPPRCAPGTL